MYVIIVVVGAVLECVVGVVEPLYNYVFKTPLAVITCNQQVTEER